MKYTAIAYNGETETKVEFNLRADANMKTLVKNAVRAIMLELGLSSCSYSAEMPNIWTNGGVGCLTINEKYFVHIHRNDNEIAIFL